MEAVAETTSSLFPPVWIIGLTLILAFLVYGYWPFLDWNDTPNMRGAKGSFLLGNMIEVLKTGMPQIDIKYRKLYGKVHFAYNGRQKMISVGDPDVLRRILVKDFSDFQDRELNFPLDPLQKNGLFFLKGDHWRFVRSVLTPTFTSGKMRGMNPLIQKCVNSLQTNFQRYADSGESFTAKTLFGAYSMDVIASVAFGLDTDSQNDPHNPFVIHAQECFKFNMWNPMLWIFVAFPAVAQLLVKLGGGLLPKSARNFFTDILSRTISERKNERKARLDFLQLIIDARKEELSSEKHEVDFDTSALATDIDRKGLSDIEIIAQAFLVMIAGYETTGTALTFTAYSFATNPEWQDKVIAEVDTVLKGEAPTYDNVLKLETLEMCVTESLRCHPPIIRSFRSADKEVLVDGHVFPKDCAISIPIYSIHHDPDLYPDHETYDPSRFSPERRHEIHPYAYLPFGIGPRNCVGMRLAQMEIRMAMAQLLQKFKFVTCDETLIPMRPAEDNLTGINKPAKPIQLKVIERKTGS